MMSYFSVVLYLYDYVFSIRSSFQNWPTSVITDNNIDFEIVLHIVNQNRRNQLSIVVGFKISFVQMLIVIVN